MISYKNGIVTSITKSEKSVDWIEIRIDDVIYKAVNYVDITGKVNLDDKVVLNTTAVELSLGTGGYHFVIYNHSNPFTDLKGEGHIMKLRYTPYQLKCFTAEEEASKYHEIFNRFESLDGHPFIVGTLHSMIAPICAMIKYLNKDIRINYIMTDGAALPIAFSKTINQLKDKQILDKTITIGNAFGGDLETTNIYTGLIAAKEILQGDITIISMGPGIVGTGTKYGFTGIEQGNNINAINNLRGRAIVVPRISFKDKRERHRGISHHTLTILSEITNTSSKVIMPILEKERDTYIRKQIENLNIQKKHEIFFEDGENILKALEYFNINITTMGRSIDEDLEYFITLGAVGKYAAKLLT